MLPSQAALCGSAGSLEMSVFQILLAGKMGQLASSAAVPPARPALACSGPASGADAAVNVAGAEAGAAAAPPQAARKATGKTSSNRRGWKLGRIITRSAAG